MYLSLHKTTLYYIALKRNVFLCRLLSGKRRLIVR